MCALVRQAVVEDAEAIATVHIRAWQTAYRGQLSDRYLDELSQDFTRRREMWRGEISSPRSAKHEVWIASVEKQVDGFVAFGPARGADPTITGEVYAIYLSPDCWGQSLGRMLFSHATNRLAFRGFSTAILWVLESNTRARRFYEIAGWTVDGRTKVEVGPDGTEFREVSYHTLLSRTNEES